MINKFNRYMSKLRDEGLSAIVMRRYRWYRDTIRINNLTVGQLVELLGNRIRTGA
jgi:hypothetical protein